MINAGERRPSKIIEGIITKGDKEDGTKDLGEQIRICATARLRKVTWNHHIPEAEIDEVPKYTNHLIVGKTFDMFRPERREDVSEKREKHAAERFDEIRNCKTQTLRNSVSLKQRILRILHNHPGTLTMAMPEDASTEKGIYDDNLAPTMGGISMVVQTKMISKIAARNGEHADNKEWTPYCKGEIWTHESLREEGGTENPEDKICREHLIRKYNSQLEKMTIGQR